MIEQLHSLIKPTNHLHAKGSTLKAYVDPVDICGPDMSNGVEGSFCYRHTRAKNIFDPDQQEDFKEFLVNEKGSVHQSFTKEDVSPVITMKSCNSN